MNGHTADELAEWLAVLRAREGKTAEPAPSAVSWIEQALADGEDDEEPEAPMLGRCRCGEPNCGGEHEL